jgi:putative salt-induced outer membrane protein YdiY
MKLLIAPIALFAFFAAAFVQADEIRFKNGDRLTGSIKSMEAGKLSIKTAVAGTVTVDMKDVSTFSTDGPIEVRLSDGTQLKQRIAASDAGQVSLTGGDVAAQNVPLASVKAINPSVGTWTGSAVVGGTLARGNTNSESLNASLHLVRRGENDRITMDAGYLWGREKVPGFRGKHETENDWFVAPKYDYFFTPKFYGYANARVERDLIAQLSLLFTPGVGVGYQWFERPDFHFNTEAGASWLYRDFRNDGTTDSAAVRLAYHVDKKLNEKVSLFHDFEYYPGLDRIDNYFFDTDAGVRADLTAKMFAELKAEYRYNSVPAPGKEHSDTRFLLGVGWNF